MPQMQYSKVCLETFKEPPANLGNPKKVLDVFVCVCVCYLSPVLFMLIG